MYRVNPRTRFRISPSFLVAACKDIGYKDDKHLDEGTNQSIPPARRTAKGEATGSVQLRIKYQYE